MVTNAKLLSWMEYLAVHTGWESYMHCLIDSAWELYEGGTTGRNSYYLSLTGNKTEAQKG